MHGWSPPFMDACMYACMHACTNVQRLELLEKERLKRMRGGGDDNEDDFKQQLPQGGFALRRAKNQAKADGGC